MHPHHHDTEHRLGQQCHQRGDPVGALEHFRRALALQPDALWSRQNLGTVLAELGRFSEAEELLAPLTDQLAEDPWGPYCRASMAARNGESAAKVRGLLNLALKRGLPDELAPAVERWLKGSEWQPIDAWEQAVVELVRGDEGVESPGMLLPAWEVPAPMIPLPELRNLPPEIPELRESLTVVIPSRDRPDLLENCLRSLMDMENWGIGPSLIRRVVVVDNGSCQPRTRRMLERWKAARGSRLVAIRREEPFNWSRLSNAGAALADTPLLLFLNDDTELLNPHRLGHLAALALEPETGAVGALLVEERSRVADAGLIRRDRGWQARWRGVMLDRLPGGLSGSAWPADAVTGACLMVKRSLFETERFDERFPADGNDTAFAETLASRGLSHWICGAAQLLHGVSSSRELNRLQ